MKSTDEEYSKVVCAWCGKVLKKSRSKVISHGICKECKEAELKKAGLI